MVLAVSHHSTRAVGRAPTPTPKKGVHRTGMQRRTCILATCQPATGHGCRNCRAVVAHTTHTLTNSLLVPSRLLHLGRQKKLCPSCAVHLARDPTCATIRTPARTTPELQWPVSGSQRERRVEREWAMVLILFSVTFAHPLNPIGQHVVASPQSTDPLYRCSTQSRRFRTLYVHVSACSSEAASGTVRQTQPGGKPPVEQKSKG